MTELAFAHKIAQRTNPLNDMEDLLEASGYSHNRDTDTRLSFMCQGKQSNYTVVLEWHLEYEAVKLSVLIDDYKSVDDQIVETAINTANKAAWHGFFMRDGAGNIAFKSIIKLVDEGDLESLSLIEDSIDKGIEEADRLSLVLSLNKEDTHSLFDDEEWKVENLVLMFSDTKGNA